MEAAHECPYLVSNQQEAPLIQGFIAANLRKLSRLERLLQGATADLFVRRIELLQLAVGS
jgi:hypothetical protein